MRKINISFWLKEVGNVIGINIIIALLIMGTWMYWCTTKLPDQVTGEHYYFNVNQEKHTLEYVIDGNDRKSYAYDFRDVRDLQLYREPYCYRQKDLCCFLRYSGLLLSEES